MVVSRETSCSPIARPFLKWAGGKRQLLPELINRLPADYARYYEPFLGGGALFFALAPRHAEAQIPSYLSDISRELMNTYRVVRNSKSRLMEALDAHRLTKQYYYRIRALDRSESFTKLPAVERAARFIFLNKTCFNGLHRVNSSGHFNVPYGQYVRPRLYDRENLEACSAALKDATLSTSTYQSLLPKLTRGDFVYLDPPYAPLSPTSRFTSYAADGFDEDAQRELFEFCCALDRLGVQFLLSNSAAPLILDLYQSRFKLELVPVTRAINRDGSRRGPVMEVMARNYDGFRAPGRRSRKASRST